MIRKATYLILLTLLTGCFGETHCPSFPENRTSWIPYQTDDTISYSDGTDTLEFIVSESYKSSPYSFKKNCKCACEANANFKTMLKAELDLRIEGYADYLGNRTIYQYNFIRYEPFESDFVFLHSDDFYFEYENENITDDIIAEYQIGNKVYKNVLKLELDTIDDNGINWRKPEIWRMIIADSIGIIQYENCKTRKTWNLVE